MSDENKGKLHLKIKEICMISTDKKKCLIHLDNPYGADILCMPNFKQNKIGSFSGIHLFPHLLSSTSVLPSILVNLIHHLAFPPVFLFPPALRRISCRVIFSRMVLLCFMFFPSEWKSWRPFCLLAHSSSCALHYVSVHIWL